MPHLDSPPQRLVKSHSRPTSARPASPATRASLPPRGRGCRRQPRRPYHTLPSSQPTAMPLTQRWREPSPPCPKLGNPASPATPSWLAPQTSSLCCPTSVRPASPATRASLPPRGRGCRRPPRRLHRSQLSSPPSALPLTRRWQEPSPPCPKLGNPASPATPSWLAPQTSSPCCPTSAHPAS